jgi:hypothetical protein
MGMIEVVIFAIAAALACISFWQEARAIPDEMRGLFGSLKDEACGRDIDCLKTAIGANAQAACSRMARKQARFFEFTRYATDPNTESFEWKEGRPGIATLRQTNVNLENNFGALTGFNYECDVDTSQGKIAGVRLAPL